MAKILIIEDDPLMCRLYEKMFTFEGYEVAIAHDGMEGIQKAQEISPTVILLDIMMPKMNGIQTLDELKSNDNTKKIPVVMLSNLNGEQDSELALSKGAINYIVKSSYEPAEVIAMIKEIIDQYTNS